MTREEEITQEASAYILSEVVNVGNEKLAFGDFINGAKWADAHPRKGLVDIDKACEWLDSVNFDYYQIREGVFSEDLIKDFRKAMEL